MDNCKVRLTMVVPGATMLSTQDCVKMSRKEAYDHSSLVFKVPKKKGKNVYMSTETCHIHTRKSRPAKHAISITDEAFKHMTDSGQIPDPKVKKAWGNMPVKERLEYHLSNIAEYFNALSFSYEILDD